MNVLIVYAHPEPKSFNGAMKDVAAATLRSAGHDVVVSDLYAMRFGAVVGPGEGHRKRLLELATVPKLFFHPAEDYGPNERLKPGVIARSGVQRNV